MNIIHPPRIHFCIYVNPKIDPSGKLFIQAHDVRETTEGALKVVTFSFVEGIDEIFETTELLIADNQWTHVVRVYPEITFDSPLTVH